MMKFSTVLIIGLIILTLTVNSVRAEQSETLLDDEHYLIVGHIYQPYNGYDITLINVRTKEQLSINIINCNHGQKEYLFNLANLNNGWKKNDKLLLIYGNQTIELRIDNSNIGIQADINKPDDVTPIAVIAGTILILTSSGYYYIKKKNKGDKDMAETKTMGQASLIETEHKGVTIAERVVVIAIFGALAGFCLYKGNFEAGAGYASTIAVYFLSRQGV